LGAIPEASAISQDREERKQHGRFSLLKAQGRLEARDSVLIRLRSRAGRLICTQDARRPFGDESVKGNERRSGCPRPAKQNARDRAVEFRWCSNARRTRNRKRSQASCKTSPLVISCRISRAQHEPHSRRPNVLV